MGTQRMIVAATKTSRRWNIAGGNCSADIHRHLLMTRSILTRISKGSPIRKYQVCPPWANFFLDQKCQTLHDQPEASFVVGTVNIGREGLTKQQQQQIRNAHACKVKKLRSDRKLFFLWLPMLVIVIIAMLMDRVPQLWQFPCQAISFVSHRMQGRLVEAA